MGGYAELEFQAADDVGQVLVASWDASDKPWRAQDGTVVQKILDFWGPHNLLTYPSANNLVHGRQEIPIEWLNRGNRGLDFDKRGFNINHMLHHAAARHLVLDIVGLLVDCEHFGASWIARNVYTIAVSAAYKMMGIFKFNFFSSVLGKHIASTQNHRITSNRTHT